MRCSKCVRAGFACCAVWAGGCVPPKQASVAAPTTRPGLSVSIDNFAFTPAELVVPAGSTVEWVNHDDVPHTVTSDGKGGVLKSKGLDTDDHYSMTFEKAGEYPYFCAIHPHMRAKVIVTK